ncbi:taxane 13-alpha-hydroxylase-like [Nymphaea colorata]|nr:taxane 13-alpha-hydroxylase-like [Nymphaea colorata]
MVHKVQQEMSAGEVFLLILATLLIFLFLFGCSSSSGSSRGSRKRVPPGSLGIPLIGQSLSFLRAMKKNMAEDWVQRKINKYGPIFKLNLFGTPTVFLCGPAANKFIFSTADADALANKPPPSITRILGAHNLLELSGADHKRVRGALAFFLRPEMLKSYVGKIDTQVKEHVSTHWQGQTTVTVMPLLKTLVFNTICSLIFGLEKGCQRHSLVNDFKAMMDGIWSVPLNVPFTSFSRALRASASARSALTRLARAKRASCLQGLVSPHQDLITYLLSMKGENGKESILSEEEVIDNALFVMSAGYDVSSTLISFIIRILATQPDVYANVAREQEEIAKAKPPGDVLSWDDLSRMKYTWRVALETLRVHPPVFGTFRTVLRDIEYGGYVIPKGWKVFWAAHATHMDPTIYANPETFEPKRFEVGQSSVVPYSFVAFGAGSRMCPGAEFARIGTLVAIHHLVTRFTWTLSRPDQEAITRNPTLSLSLGLPICLQPKTLASLN